MQTYYARSAESVRHTFPHACIAQSAPSVPASWDETAAPIRSFVGPHNTEISGEPPFWPWLVRFISLLDGASGMLRIPVVRLIRLTTPVLEEFVLAIPTQDTDSAHQLSITI